MNIFKKWFCLHKWKGYAKTKFRYTHEEYEYTEEVLICECCGKIKKIKY